MLTDDDAMNRAWGDPTDWWHAREDASPVRLTRRGLARALRRYARQCGLWAALVWVLACVALAIVGR